MRWLPLLFLVGCAKRAPDPTAHLDTDTTDLTWEPDDMGDPVWQVRTAAIDSHFAGPRVEVEYAVTNESDFAMDAVAVRIIVRTYSQPHTEVVLLDQRVPPHGEVRQTASLRVENARAVEVELLDATAVRPDAILTSSQ